MGIFFRTKKNELLGDRFRLIEEVGKGSFGEVWRAERLSDGKHVAIKIPKDQEKGEEVLRKEADIVRGIIHPNIVQVYAFHNISELFFIEMEFIDGFSLAAILQGSGSASNLSFMQMLDWLVDILDGLATVHHRNISHNDLKPENILIAKDSNKAKITDFGVSRRFEDAWVWTKRHGTEAYMAPEVALEGKRSKVSDIYSLGVLLYEMTTGSLPYTSPHQLLTGLNITKPREVNTDIPSDLEKVILKAMARRPEKRYQNVSELRGDIDNCIKSLTTSNVIAELPSRVSTKQDFQPPSSSPLYYLELAKKKLSSGDHQGALEAAEAAVDRSDEHPQYLRMLGGICIRVGYKRKAITAYERLMVIYERGYPVENRQKIEVIERLGSLYLDEQFYEKAIEIYRSLVKINSSSYSKFKLSIAYGLDGEYRQAIQLLEEVRQEKPDVLVVYNKLAWAHALNGDDQLALSFHNQALAIDAFDLFSLFHLGQYYHIIGDRRRSSEYFQRLFTADKIGDYSAKAKKLTGEDI
jgi:serine/threonine protein kinase